MQHIIEFYKNQLGFENFYDIIVNNMASDTKEFIQSANFLKGVSTNTIKSNSKIISHENDYRIDVPVWFGDLVNSKRRVIIFGLEPRDTNSNFNIEKIDNKIFGSPFGIDRWNSNSSVKRKPQNRYFRVFNSLVSDETNFVLFSDIVKDYKILKTNNEGRKNDTNAREYFFKKAEEQFSLLRDEIKMINPTHILTLGKDSHQFLINFYPKITFRLRHPANGGEKKAKEEIKIIIK